MTPYSFYGSGTVVDLPVISGIFLYRMHFKIVSNPVLHTFYCGTQTEHCSLGPCIVEGRCVNFRYRLTWNETITLQ